MKKNVASQSIGAQMITAADGTNFTGTVTVVITIDNGTQSASGGTAPAHEGNGYHSYTPTQAETNGDHLAYTFTGTGAITHTVQTFTEFPQTVDNDVLASGATGFAAIDTVVDAILVDTAQIGTAGAGLTNINLPNQTMDIVGNITGNLSGSVGSLTTNNDKTGYSLTQTFPTNFSSQVITAGGAVDSLIQGYLNTLITETSAGRISNNFDFFYDNANAQTTQVVDDVGGGGGGGTDWTASERNEIRGRIGITGTTASGGNTPTLALEATVATVDGVVDAILVDTNDLQTNQGNWLTATGFSTAAEMAKVPKSDSTVTWNATALASINTQCDTALTDYDGPTNAEMIARTLLAGSYYDFTTDKVILLTATQASIDAIETDTSTTLPGLIDDLAVKKNATFSNFEFLMVLTSDGRTPATGLTVTGQRSIDGAAFTGVSGTIAEVSNGIYQFDAIAADTNGDLITWRFISATADDTFVTFKTVA